MVDTVIDSSSVDKLPEIVVESDPKLSGLKRYEVMFVGELFTMCVVVDAEHHIDAHRRAVALIVSEYGWRVDLYTIQLEITEFVD